jgi:hypothetical protein
VELHSICCPWQERNGLLWFTVISIGSMDDDDFRRFDEGTNGSKIGLAMHYCLAVTCYNEYCRALS